MATHAHTLEHHDARLSGPRIALRGAGRSVWRWLAADPRDTVELRPLGEHHLDPARDVSHSPDAKTSLSATDGATADAAELCAGLRQWRSRLRLRRAGIALRRQLIAAAALAVALQALALPGLLPESIALAVPAALLLIAAVLELRRRPSLDGVARLLDERLRLFDQLATALEIQRRDGAGRRPLERRALARASALVSASLEEWRPVGRNGAREWASLGAALALLALFVIVVQPVRVQSGGTSRSGAITAASSPGAAGAQRAQGHIGSRASGAVKPRPPSLSQLRSSPSGHAPANPYGGPSSGYHSPSGQSLTYSQGLRANESVNVPRAPAQRSPDVGVPKLGSGSTSTSGSTGQAPGKGFSGIGAASTEGAISPVTAPNQQSASPALAAPKGAANEPGSSTPSAGRPSNSQSAGANQSSASGGTPSASQTAGHQRAGTQLANSGAPRGQASHNLPLQAGYAPIRTGRLTRSGKAGNGSGGGGGPGRSVLVEGASSAGGEGTFPYVPSEGGSVFGANTALLVNYFR
jgi:hypothetical protein